MHPIHVIGGGLAGCEAAWQIARREVPVVLHEMRPLRGTEAHRTERLAELVCSNSFRSDDAQNNAVGVIHREMRALGSLIMRAADAHQVPAGGALAVDRDGFSAAVEAAIASKPAHSRRARRNRRPAAGRLGQCHHRHRAADLAGARRGDPRPDRRGGAGVLRRHRADRASRFHRHVDGLAPVALRQGRPRRHGRRLHQLPDEPRQYEAFVDALLAAEKTEFREFEGTPYFDGCLPIEVMAERGRETLRHGPMKPVGLTNAHDPKVKPYAVVQLRQDNALGTLFNMVGFQTKLKYGEQARVLRLIPGLERRRIRAARRPASQHLPQFAAPAWIRACASRPSRACASPGRSPAAKAMSRAPRSG